LPVLNNPPEIIVQRKNKPVPTTAVSSIELSSAPRFIWKMVVTRKMTAANEMSLWIVKIITLSGFPEWLNQTP